MLQRTPAILIHTLDNLNASTVLSKRWMLFSVLLGGNLTPPSPHLIKNQFKKEDFIVLFLAFAGPYYIPLLNLI